MAKLLKRMSTNFDKFRHMYTDVEMGALKMRERKMQEWKMREHIAGVENAGVENSGVDRRGGKCRSGKYRSDKVWKAIRRRQYSKVTRRNISFHAGLRRRIKVPHHNLSAFFGHLQRIIIDSVSDVSRVTRGLAIRRAKKRVNLTNDKHIKICIADI